MLSGWVGDQDATFAGLKDALKRYLQSAWAGELPTTCANERSENVHNHITSLSSQAMPTLVQILVVTEVEMGH